MHHPKSYDAIRFSSIVESAGKRGTTSHREIPLVKKNQEKLRMLQNLVEDT